MLEQLDLDDDSSATSGGTDMATFARVASGDDEGLSDLQKWWSPGEMAGLPGLDSFTDMNNINSIEDFATAMDALNRTQPEYVFAADNPFAAHPDPYQAGINAYQAGDTNAAILAMEATVTQDANNSDAWLILGTAHAENDEDQKAIVPLMNAIETDPGNLDAILELGVSYTNELDQMQALVVIRQWLEAHPQYNRFIREVPAEDNNPFAAHLMLHQHILSEFTAAAQAHPDDADIHTVMGVLYHVTHNYDPAVSAFEKALELDPERYSLWNKLGATHANAFRSKLALYAYHRALELKPNYVRAWVNLGIAYGTEKKWQESAKHYMKALSLNPAASHLWNYLKHTYEQMGRPDLAARAETQDRELLGIVGGGN